MPRPHCINLETPSNPPRAHAPCLPHLQTQGHPQRPQVSARVEVPSRHPKPARRGPGGPQGQPLASGTTSATSTPVGPRTSTCHGRGPVNEHVPTECSRLLPCRDGTPSTKTLNQVDVSTSWMHILRLRAYVSRQGTSLYPPPPTSRQTKDANTLVLSAILVCGRQAGRERPKLAIQVAVACAKCRPAPPVACTS